MRQESDEEFGVELHTGRTYGGHLDSDVMAPHTMGRSQHNTHRRRTVWLERTILACALVGVAVLAVILIVNKSENSDCGSSDHGEKPVAPFNPVEQLFRLVKPENMKTNLHDLTVAPHVAGTQGDYDTVNIVKQSFVDAGLETTLDQYEVLLNWPIENGTFVTLHQAGQPSFNASLKEDTVASDPVTKVPRFGAFHGYAKAGQASGTIVYANYGRKEDFDALKAAGISCAGSIVMVRYGRIFRGNKVALAEAAGAVGVIVYSDPADDGYTRGEVYPEGPWRSNSSFQRGSVFTGEGDPLTPHFPATPDSLRLTTEEASEMGPDGWALPNIPSVPMSYADAKPILRAMQGFGKPVAEVGADWEGGLPLNYYTGPTNASVTLDMGTAFDAKVRSIWNVLGTIRGHEEPDRMVILGNHRDAWVAGAVDPNSGTCVLMELARTFGEMVKMGWRPRRTIVFASWDAEEYALVGSTEYVERLVNVLHLQAVAYLNVDMAVSSMGSLTAAASPALIEAVYAAAKQVLQPDCPFKSDPQAPPTVQQFCTASTPQLGETMYDFWLRKNPAPSSNPKRPSVPPLGSGSDFTPFQQFVGVSSVDLEVRGLNGMGDYYAVYHSVYDSYVWMTSFVDPTFTYHSALGQVWGALAVSLADEVVLPLAYEYYADSVSNMADSLQQLIDASPSATKTALNPMMPRLETEIAKFANASHYVELARQAINAKADSDEVINTFRKARALNDALMAGERSFILREGLPGRAWDKHVLFTPSATNSYGASIFPGVTDAMAEGDIRLAQKQLDVICHLLAQATAVLENAVTSVFSL